MSMPGSWEVVPLPCYVAPRLSEWFVCRDLGNGHVEHLCHKSGKQGMQGSIRHFKNEGDAIRAAADANLKEHHDR
jgi:hypothetical protein